MASNEPNFQLFTTLRYDPILVHCLQNTVLSNGPSPFYMLPFHRDRLCQAAEHFGWSDAGSSISSSGGLLRLEEELHNAIKASFSLPPLRIKIILHITGVLHIEISSTPPVYIANLFPARLPPKTVQISPLVGGSSVLSQVELLDKSEPLPAMLALDPLQKEPWTLVLDPVETDPSDFTTYKTTRRDIYEMARKRVGFKSMSEPQEVLIISSIDNWIMEGSLTTVYFWREGEWVTPPLSCGGQNGTTRRWMLQHGLCREGAVSSDSLVDGEECWLSNGLRGLIPAKVQLRKPALPSESRLYKARRPSMMQ